MDTLTTTENLIIDFEDLGNATKETKQGYPAPIYADSLYGMGDLRI